MTINQFLKNVSDSLKLGGKFLATCLDGKHIFERLMDTPFIEGRLDGNVVWSILKKYDHKIMNDDETCLGMNIDVFIETINQTLTECLVNIDYLVLLAKSYNLKIIKRNNFRDIYDANTEIENMNNYGEIEKFISDSKYDQIKEYRFHEYNSSF